MKRLLILSMFIFFLSTTVVARAAGLVKGTPDFQAHVSAALDFVRRIDPGGYARTIRYITRIEQNEKAWSWVISYNGACKVELSSAYATWQYDNAHQLAGDLVHEGSLCRDYFLGNTADVKADEMRALHAQRQFYVRSRAPQYLVDYMNSLIAQNWPWGK